MIWDYAMTDTRPIDFFPFGRQLSLHKLLALWRRIAETAPGEAQKEFARSIVARAEAVPILSSGVASSSEYAPYRDLIVEMMGAVLPVSHYEKGLFAAMAPFNMDTFYASPGFLTLLERESDAVENGAGAGFASVDEMKHAKTMDAFHVILRCLYGVDTPHYFPSLFTTVSPEQLVTHYRLLLDTDYTDIDVIGELPELTAEQIGELVDAPMNVDLWTRYLPPEKFVFRGFTVVGLMDVTEQEVQGRLKNDLLQKDALTTARQINSIERNLRTLLKIPDLRIGVLGLTTGKIEDIEHSRTFGRSLLMDSGSVPQCPHKDKSTYAKLFETGEPVIVSDLEACEYCTGFEHHIRQLEFRGLMLVPLKDGNRLTGVLELATWRSGELNAFTLAKLMEVVTLFSAAMRRSMDEREDRLQALIKKEFTSIHPSVEWRFRRAAEKLEANAVQSEMNDPEEIVFENVFPLYGLSDIRDSSVKRTGAIQGDLVEQLGLALSVIVQASSHQPLPALDELGFRLSKFAQSVGSGFSSEDEVGALEFLRRDVEPLFERLAGAGPDVKRKVDEYWSRIDRRLGVLYENRKGYEESVTQVNTTISSFLQRQQAEAQAMFPHYFEKFETDGVDYNIYVGESIAGRSFDPLYLRNLRLWQLLTMCGVVWELNSIQEKLPLSLELAHLILVQDFPIAIRFSKDEKRFGVDGAYNARYMIVKKRIDKAHVRGSSERITQPGKLAIVYSQEKERREYLRFIDYLSAAGYIEKDIEEFDVEPLQGVNGLRVLRVTVAPERPQMELRARPELAVNQKTAADKSAAE